MVKPELKKFITAIPKMELHIHLEGSMQPVIALKLAERNGITLPFSDEKSARNFYRFTSLTQFIEKAILIISTLKTSDDFATIVTELGADSARQNVPYREVAFSYSIHKQRGITWDTIIKGLSKGREEAKKRFNVEMKFIADVDRTLPTEEGLELVDLVVSSRDKLPILGIGLSNAEIGYPPKKHKLTFARARQLGLHVVAHAGEDVGPESVWGSIKELKVERIDHGVRSVEDPQLIEYLARTQIPLTVCPVSNVSLKVFPSMAKHSVKSLMDAGVFTTINSDDPGIFNSDLIDNYWQVATQFNIKAKDIEKLASNSIKASFLKTDEKERYEEELRNKAVSLKASLNL